MLPCNMPPTTTPCQTVDSDYDKLNIKVRAAMGHGFEVKMVTGNRTCNG